MVSRTVATKTGSMTARLLNPKMASRASSRQAKAGAVNVPVFSMFRLWHPAASGDSTSNHHPVGQLNAGFAKGVSRATSTFNVGNTVKELLKAFRFKQGLNPCLDPRNAVLESTS